MYENRMKKGEVIRIELGLVAIYGLVDQISTEGKLPVLPLGVSAPFRSQASQGVLIY